MFGTCGIYPIYLFYEEEREKTPSDCPASTIYKVLSEQSQRRLERADWLQPGQLFASDEQS